MAKGSRAKSEWIRAALDRYEGALTRYATGMTGDVEEARDIVQETFLRLCRETPSRLRGHLAQWLFTVCRNLALDVRRKERRMEPMGAIQIEETPDQSPRPPIILERKEAVGQILQILETLPPREQEVIRLKFQNGLSYKEISEITHLTVTNVGFLIHTALKKIRSEIDSEAPPTREALRRIK